jgi:hypothetical protein
VPEAVHGKAASEVRSEAAVTPAERTALIARAKALAIPVASCVAACVRPDHLIGDASRDELAALVIVLAEAADPVALKAVVDASGDSAPVTDRDLRVAHARAVALRKAGKTVPFQVRVLDGEYHRQRRQARAAGPGAVQAGSREAA